MQIRPAKSITATCSKGTYTLLAGVLYDIPDEAHKATTAVSGNHTQHYGAPMPGASTVSYS